MTTMMDVFRTQEALAKLLKIDLENVYRVIVDLKGDEIPSVTVWKYLNIEDSCELQELEFDLILKEKRSKND